MRLTHIFLASISALLPLTLAETSKPPDAFPFLNKAVSKLGMELGVSPESLSPKPLAHDLIDQTFGTLEAAVLPLPGPGKTMARLLSGTRERAHNYISAYSLGSPAPKTCNALSDWENSHPPYDVDEDSSVGEALEGIVSHSCECLGVTLNLGVHLARALQDAVFGFGKNLIGKTPGLGAVLHVLPDQGETLRGPFHNNLTALADVLTVETICGHIASGNITTGDIDEDSTVTKVWTTLLPAECRCLTTLLYLIVHLARSLLEFVLHTLIALIGSFRLGDPSDELLSILRILKTVLHDVLTDVANFSRPQNLCKVFFVLEQ